MDNAQKAIMIGVGLFITIIIISAVMLITSAGQDMVDDSMNQLSGIQNQLSSSEWNSLDGKYMNGAQVISYVKKYYNSTDFLCYYVATNGTSVVKASKIGSTGTVSASSTAVSAVSVGTSDLSSTGKITDNTSTTTYISSTATYQGVLLKTSSGDPVGVIFVKK